MQTLSQDPRFGLKRSITFPDDQPLLLESGVQLAPLSLAYESYGQLNAQRSNAILVFHALTGDQHMASPHPITGKEGWWQRVVGPGMLLDTDRFCILCANILGGCMGSTGPTSRNPATGTPYAMAFPVITIADMVRAQAMLLDYLEIDQLFCIIGGSMGGMQALEWLARYPKRTLGALLLATTARHSAQNIAFHEVGRQAIMADPNWHQGDYLTHHTTPANGLAVARMAAHITYLSQTSLTQKFGRKLQDRAEVSFGFDADFQVESYLRYQGIRFVERFDANSYLYITRAMDYFDLSHNHGKPLAQIFQGLAARVGVISFTSDWLYPTAESRRIVHALAAAGVRASFVEIDTPYGHDSFLLDVPEMDAVLQGFLSSLANQHAL
jgi:homoserine O-acetyltransferase/O-succinyltransferase